MPMQHILKISVSGRGLFLCLTILFSSLASIVWSCDLADHSWQGALKEVKIEGPIFTFAETGLCSNFLNIEKTRQIQLSLKQKSFLWLHLLIKELHNSWVNKLPHVFFSRTGDKISSLKPTVGSPIIGYKDYKLRIGYFADKNLSIAIINKTVKILLP
jgi:hypothetical protein